MTRSKYPKHVNVMVSISMDAQLTKACQEEGIGKGEFIRRAIGREILSHRVFQEHRERKGKTIG